MQNEPLITVASITAIVAAVIGLLAAFGLSLTDVQIQAMLGFVAVAAPFVVAFIARSRVTPVDGSARRRRNRNLRA